MTDSVTAGGRRGPANGHEAFHGVGPASGMDRSPLVSKIVGALADAEGVDPAELDFVLQNHVDADAVEALARYSDTTWTLSFEVPGHTVTVTDERVVLVDGARVEPAWP